VANVFASPFTLKGYSATARPPRTLWFLRFGESPITTLTVRFFPFFLRFRSSLYLIRNPLFCFSSPANRLLRRRLISASPSARDYVHEARQIALLLLSPINPITHSTLSLYPFLLLAPLLPRRSFQISSFAPCSRSMLPIRLLPSEMHFVRYFANR
jgi:hypothetical protein